MNVFRYMTLMIINIIIVWILQAAYRSFLENIYRSFIWATVLTDYIKISHKFDVLNVKICGVASFQSHAASTTSVIFSTVCCWYICLMEDITSR